VKEGEKDGRGWGGGSRESIKRKRRGLLRPEGFGLKKESGKGGEKDYKE